MVKKILSLAISVALLITLLTSCGIIVSRLDTINKIDKSDRGNAERILLEILDALEKKDGEALKNMLSEEAIENAEDLDEDIQYVLDFYQGTHTEYTIGGITSGGSYRYGELVEYSIQTRFEVTTDVKSYVIAIGGNIIDEKNPEKAGLNCIQIVSATRTRDFVGLYGIYEGTEKTRKEKEKEYNQ